MNASGDGIALVYILQGSASRRVRKKFRLRRKIKIAWIGTGDRRSYLK